MSKLRSCKNSREGTQTARLLKTRTSWLSVVSPEHSSSRTPTAAPRMTLNAWSKERQRELWIQATQWTQAVGIRHPQERRPHQLPSRQLPRSRGQRLALQPRLGLRPEGLVHRLSLRAHSGQSLLICLISRAYRRHRRNTRNRCSPQVPWLARLRQHPPTRGLQHRLQEWPRTHGRPLRQPAHQCRRQ